MHELVSTLECIMAALPWPLSSATIAARRQLRQREPHRAESVISRCRRCLWKAAMAEIAHNLRFSGGVL